MAEYTAFIPENTALPDVRRIGVYNRKGNRVGSIALGELSLPEGKKRYSFGALSDVHLQDATAQDDFQRALTYLTGGEKVAFSCIAGDLTSGGTEAELTQYKNCVDAFSAHVPVYAITGNHDVRCAQQQNIAQYTGQPLHYAFSYGDDVFIMLGVNAEAAGRLFTKDQLQWLYETLEENRNRRCFVFHHVRPQDGCGNALGIYAYDLWGGTEASVFESMMRHYKNAHQFHGHSHLKLHMQKHAKLANIDHLFGGWSIHVPSLSIPRDTNGAVNPSTVDVYADSEGYVVDVYDNGIHLRGMDFIDLKPIPMASYWLDTSICEITQGTYKDPTGTIITE